MPASALRVVAAVAAVAAAAAGGHSRDWLSRYNPAANPDAVRTIGHARFTVLTEGTVRMEYEDNGVFDDEATITILHRHLPAPAFKSTTKGTALTIETSKWRLTYDAAGGAFTPLTLRVALLVEPFTVWTPSSEATGNMHGTIRTLDRVGHAVDLKCPPVTSTMVYYTVRRGAGGGAGRRRRRQRVRRRRAAHLATGGARHRRGPPASVATPRDRSRPPPPHLAPSPCSTARRASRRATAGCSSTTRCARASTSTALRTTGCG